MTPAEQIASLPESVRYAVEERAAILEYDGGMKREDAEKLALDMWMAGLGR